MPALTLCAMLLAYGGLAAIGYTMDRHYADLHGRGAEPAPALRRRLRLAGWCGIAAAFFACVGASGWHIGPVAFCGVLAVAAMVLTLLLQYAPQRAMTLARFALPLAAAAAILLSLSAAA